MSFNRRTFLRNMGVVSIAGIQPLLARKVHASVLSTPHFYLPGSGGELWTEVALEDRTVMQSFGFDNANGYVFTLQVTYGGGDGGLTLTKLSLSGVKLGYMLLTGFGHGVSMGVEPVGDSTYLWTEVDSVGSGSAARGVRIGRFEFVNGATLDTTSSSITKYTLVPGSTVNTCNIDPVYNRLILRYDDSGTMKFNIYDLNDVKTNGASATVLARYSDRTTGTPQGYCLYGSYIYSLAGTAYEYCPGSDSRNVNNMTIFEFDTNPPNTLTTFLTGIGASYDYREPEGMAIQWTNYPNTNAPEVRLAIGFAREANCSSSVKYATIFYKDQLVS